MLQFVCLLFLVSPIINAQNCRTTSDSPSPNTPCKFPFKYQGELRKGCITDRDGRTWCSTKVDRNLNHIKGFWGFCPEDNCQTNNDQKCQTTSDSPSSNTPCAFPFRFDGVLNYGCTTDADPDGRHWCSTKTDDAMI